jgi:glycosyltransferase involved in cell wall biosynthesis
MARKDYPTLVRAMACAPLRDLDLVIAGPPGYRHEEVTSLVTSLGLEGRVTFSGRVSDSRLAALYQHAEALCFTSVVEGFGLPLVEAMSSGLPIVSSDIEVAREVAGPAAVYFPVGEAEALAEAVRRVVHSAELRERLVAAGRARSEEFTWDRTAELTEVAYARAVAGE